MVRLTPQLFNYLKFGCLVDNEMFERCTKRYYGDTTFEEAFTRTGDETRPRDAELQTALCAPPGITSVPSFGITSMPLRYHPSGITPRPSPVTRPGDPTQGRARREAPSYPRRL